MLVQGFLDEILPVGPRRPTSAFTAGCMLALGIALHGAVAAAGKPTDGSGKLDDVRFRNGIGVELRIGDLRGRVVLLYTFNSTQPAARESLAFVSALRKCGGSDLMVLALSFDRDLPTFETFLEEVRPSVPLLLDPSGELATTLGVDDVPTAILLDRDGNVRWQKAIGVRADHAPLERALLETLAE